jgi:hypothetical protein
MSHRFNANLALSNNPVMKALGVDAVPGVLVVSDDPAMPNVHKKDRLTFSASLSLFKSQTTVKFHDQFQKANILFTDESPMGSDRCRGDGIKQKAEPKTPS